MKNKIRSALAILAFLLTACQTPTLPTLPVQPPTQAAAAPTPDQPVKELPTVAPTAPPTEVPTPLVIETQSPTGCLLAWAANDSLSCQLEGGAILNLFMGVTGANSPRISPSGQWIAFKIPQADLSEQLWVINIDGSAPRLLVNPLDLPAVETGFTPSVLNYEWLAGDAGLLFNTSRVPVSAEIGMYDPNINDLWLVDFSSGSRSQLLASGEGGLFSLSPDRQYVAVSLGTSINLYSVAGGDLNAITRLPFESILTYSEYAYKPTVYWSPDSTFFSVLIPSKDPLAADTSGSIFRVGVDGSINLLSTQAGNFVFGAGSYSISPDGNWLASGSYDTSSQYSLRISATDGGISSPVATAQGLNGLAWSADSRQFAYAVATSDTSGSLHSVSLDGTITDLASAGRVISAGWLDGSSLVYLTLDGSGWKLWFASPGGSASLVSSGAGSNVQFDLR